MAHATHPLHDLVVVLPGILGSTLVRGDAEVWAPSGGAALRVIRSFGGSLKALELPEGIGDQHPNDGIEPGRLMPDLHVLPGIWSFGIGYDRLRQFLRTRFGLTEGRNLLPVAYDWRLSNRYNGRRLKGIVEPALEQWRAQGGEYAEARLIFICHSMGGLVARWYIEREGGRPLTRKLVTLGTPFRGSLKALDQLMNGTHKGIGPLQVDFSRFSRSLPALHQLLPEYACIDDGSGGLKKTTEVACPELDTAMVRDAMTFHDELNAAAQAGGGGYDLHPIVGNRQATRTTGRLVNGRLMPLDTINGVDEQGDATVPRLAATPKDVRTDSNIIRGIVDEHGSLQHNGAALDEIEFVLTGNPVNYRAGEPIELSVRVPDLLLAGEPLAVEATLSPRERRNLLAIVKNEQGVEVTRARLTRADEVFRTTFPELPPGAYGVHLEAIGTQDVAPITRMVLVWDEGLG